MEKEIQDCLCSQLHHDDRKRSCAVCEMKSGLSPDPWERMLRRWPEMILNDMVDELPKKRRRPNKKRRRGYRGLIIYKNPELEE